MSDKEWWQESPAEFADGFTETVELHREEGVLSTADWKAIEAQSDLEAIQTDQDAVSFIQKYFVKDLQPDYLKLYRSSRHEMGRTPSEALQNLLSLPPIQ